VSERPALAVLGAINVDLVVSGAPLPRPGETVTGGIFSRYDGGKGGNQAVAAARSAVIDVWVLGAVGDDEFGADALRALSREGVLTDHVLVTGRSPTGVALIAVDPNAENQISVAPGANLELTGDRVTAALDRIRPGVVLASLEVGEGAVASALAWGHEHAITTILNPAPWQPWAGGLVGSASYVTPNVLEREAIDAIPARVIVIETRGADGVVIDRDGAVEPIAAPIVDVVDTTGAGDCFNGVVAAAFAVGRSLTDAVTDAVIAAALSVRVRGAREGMPDAATIAAWRANPGGRGPSPAGTPR
jgi:ribokinase